MNSTVSCPDTGVWLFPEAPAPELVASIRLAEQLGLDQIWLGDEGPAQEPFAVLAAAAQVTTSIALGIGITNPYVRHPALAAKMGATCASFAVECYGTQEHSFSQEEFWTRHQAAFGALC